MFRFAIPAGLLLAVIFAAAGGAYGGYAATHKSPPGSFLVYAVACGIMSGAIGFPLGAVLAALVYAAFHWLRANPMGYGLRTLLIVLGVAPPMLAGCVAVAISLWSWLSPPPFDADIRTGNRNLPIGLPPPPSGAFAVGGPSSTPPNAAPPTIPVRVQRRTRAPPSPFSRDGLPISGSRSKR